jgi:hypothetical protein
MPLLATTFPYFMLACPRGLSVPILARLICSCGSVVTYYCFCSETYCWHMQCGNHAPADVRARLAANDIYIYPGLQREPRSRSAELEGFAHERLITVRLSRVRLRIVQDRTAAAAARGWHQLMSFRHRDSIVLCVEHLSTCVLLAHVH